jgi:hypothetical protein
MDEEIDAEVRAALRLAGPREGLVDNHMYRPGPDFGPRSASFRLQLFTASGLRPVAVATQTVDESPSLTNAAERYAEAVWEQHCPREPEPPLWVQRQLSADRPPAHGEEQWQLVTFADAEPFELHIPRWHTLTDDQLDQLVGSPVDPDRGAGYVPRPAEPEPELYFEVWPVSRLPRPEPFREPRCMPGGPPQWRRLLHSALPTGWTACCWYHGGDWHAVTSLALTVLDLAHREDVPAEAMADYSDQYARAEGATVWQRQALASLFSLANAIQPGAEGHYINGQHRAQAMMDAEVPRTVVLIHQ